jgi:hypothetical protein
MRIAAFDLGSYHTGYANGIAGGDVMPAICVADLRKRGQPVWVAPGQLGIFVRDRFRVERPDLIVVEDYLNPAASRSADATIAQLLCHGSLYNTAAQYSIAFRSVAPGTARAHFCGKASAAEPRARGAAPKTSRQKNDDRERTNMMVVKRAIQLGYLPFGCTDWDKASAACLWDYGAAHFARAVPRELKLFSEAA